jgi:hypothetical protein
MLPGYPMKKITPFALTQAVYEDAHFSKPILLPGEVVGL